MKYLFIFTLFFISCSPTPRLDPKFRYDQRVIVTSSFYRGLQGTISSWKYCTYESKDGDLRQGVCYDLHTTKGTTLIYTLTDVHEEELTAVEGK
jgi:hypothetical protein